jgi:carotenoid cleavage dioxygenase
MPEPALVHDFAITEHHTIFSIFPMYFRAERLAQGQLPLVFEGNTPARYAVLPRHGGDGDLQWYEGPPCFAYHLSNAYEEGEDLVMEGCRAARASLMGVVHVQGPTPQPAATTTPADNRAHMYRWRFHRSRGTVTEERIDESPVDFPRINDTWMGRKNRYTYCALCSRSLTTNDAVTFRGLVKYEGPTRARETHLFGHRRYGGEGLFVPRPGATKEDDGWVLALVHDETSQTDELLVIEAQDFTSPPVARIHVPTRVPYGFHGTWIPRRA